MRGERGPNLWIITSEVGLTRRATPALLACAAERGLSLKPIVPERCACVVGGAGELIVEEEGEALPLPDAVIHYRAARASEMSLSLAHLLERAGVPVLNGRDAVLLGRDKQLTLQTLAAAGVPVPRTRLVPLIEGSPPTLPEAPMVAKRPIGALGQAVWKVDDDDALAALATRLAPRAEALLLQQYIETQPSRDIRLYVVGDQVPGMAMRQAGDGDWKTNLATGGQVWEVPVDDEARDLGLRVTRALGLDFAGIDLLITESGYLVNEVNPAPAFLSRYDGSERSYNLPSLILDLALERAAQARGA